MSKFFVSIFFIHLCSILLWAEGAEIRVVLANGDRLSGQLVSQGSDKLTLNVAYLGEVVLERSLIAEIEGVEADLALADGGDVEDNAEEEPAAVEVAKGDAKVKPAADEKAVAESRSDEATVAAAEKVGGGQKATVSGNDAKPVVSSGEAKPGEKRRGGLLAIISDWEEEFNPMPKWKKNLQFGFNSTSGRRDLSTLNYRLDMSRKIEKHRLNFNADYAYGEANGATNLDKFSSRFRWRKDFSPGVFYEAQSEYSRDSIKLIDSNIEQKVGLGTRLLDSESSTLSAGLGAIGRWREVNKKGMESDSLVNLFQDWDYQLTEKVSLRQDFKFAMPTDETDDYEIDFAAAIRSEVTKSINLSVRFQLGFDNSLPEDRREDRRLISSLGYSF